MTEYSMRLRGGGPPYGIRTYLGRRLKPVLHLTWVVPRALGRATGGARGRKLQGPLPVRPPGQPCDRADSALAVSKRHSSRRNLPLLNSDLAYSLSSARLAFSTFTRASPKNPKV